MIRIGITGGIGSGKSTVCRLFGLLGVPVYDSDLRARRLMDEDPGLVARITNLLGPDAYRDGRLDRAWVASQVFGDERLLARLNALVHPAVGRDFLDWAARFERGGVAVEGLESDVPLVVQEGRIPYVAIESAILIESGFGTHVDRIVAVTAPRELRIERSLARGGITEEAVRQRMERQADDEAWDGRADHLIVNDGRPLLEQVLALHADVEKLARERNG